MNVFNLLNSLDELARNEPRRYAAILLIDLIVCQAALMLARRRARSGATHAHTLWWMARLGQAWTACLGLYLAWVQLS